MIERTDLYYGSEIPRSAVDQVLKKTEEIIRIKQICKNEIPTLCSTSTKFMMTENLQNIIQKAQQKPKIQKEVPYATISQTDNFTPFLIKHKGLTGRISLDSDTARKSSACKSTREQYTASTNNRKKEKDFSQTFSGSFFQQRAWTQTQCRKRNSRTAGSSGRGKEIKLRQQLLNSSNEDESRRSELRQKRKKQQIQKQRAHEAFLKMSYHKRLIKEEFESAKIVDQKPTCFLKKDTQTIEIANFEFDDNGVMLTNRFRAPFKRTIENMINLKFEDNNCHDRIFRRRQQVQCDVENPKKKKNEQLAEEQIHKNSLMNQAYSNSGNRQLSLIPYVAISPGVSLSESAIKATILRSRPLGQTSRQKFFSTIQNRTFRSYTKDYSQKKVPIQNQMKTIDVCVHNKASKSSLNQETKDSFKKSILWGVKTSRDGHKIRLQKQELLNQLID